MIGIISMNATRGQWTGSRFQAGTLIALLSAFTHAYPIATAPFTVTTTNDSGPGSLRQAMIEANAEGGGTIAFSNVTGAIVLTSPLPAVSANTTIRGPGMKLLTLSGNNTSRVFAFNAGTTNVVSGLTIANGRTTNQAPGAGIFNAGNLMLDGCAVAFNRTAHRSGAGIFNSGMLTVLNSLIHSNEISLKHGGFPTYGAGLYATGAVTHLRNCSFMGNITPGGDGVDFYEVGGDGYGGAVCVEQGRLTCLTCIFSNNLAHGGRGAYGYQGPLGPSADPGSGCGGALACLNTIANIEKCEFLNNTTRGYKPSAPPFGGGAIFSRASALTITESMIIGNQTWGGRSQVSGAGIFASSGVLFATNCHISGNQIQGGYGQGSWKGEKQEDGGIGVGGGVAFLNCTGIIANCTLANNQAFGGEGGDAYESWDRNENSSAGGDGMGAGMFVGGNADLLLINTTISGNDAAGGGGGVRTSFYYPGVYWTNRAGSSYGGVMAIVTGSVSAVNCTFYGNRATAPEVTNSYGGIYNQGGTVRLRNTILAGNVASEGPDAYGAIESQGCNLIGQTNQATGFSDADLIKVDPKLGPLQDNGGPTWTHALLSGSPAMDAGNSNGLLTDQRGQPRTVDNPSVPSPTGGDGTDIGAFEANPVLRFTEMRAKGTNLVMRFTTVSDKNYRLQYRTNLTGAGWVALPERIAGSGGIVNFTNLWNLGLTQRFYRVFEE